MAGTGSELVMKKTAALLCSILCCTAAFAQMVIDGVRLEPPRQDGIWVRPAQDTPSMAVWGFADGIRVGINPPGRPRGLLDIYAPYLGAGDMTIINYIAMEPIVASSQNRGYSELESSALDGVQGKHKKSPRWDYVRAGRAAPDPGGPGSKTLPGSDETRSALCLPVQNDRGRGLHRAGGGAGLADRGPEPQGQVRPGPMLPPGLLPY